MSEPEPFTVNVSPLKPALPVTPTAPTSVSIHGAGNVLEELTVSVTVSLCDVLPLVPVAVIVYVPAGVEVDVAMVKVDEPGAVTEPALKLAVAPAGNPPAFNETVPLKPLILPTLTVYEA